MADLKAGTTVAGAAIWNASNLQVIPAGNFLTYRGFKVYTSGDKPTATDLGFLPAAGGAMTGALTSNSDITTNKIVEGQQLRATYRGVICRTGGTPFVDFIRPDLISDTSPPTSTQTLGLIRFLEGSKTSDIHGGANRAYIETLLLADTSSRLNFIQKDASGTIKNAMVMDSRNGLTHVSSGDFRVTGTTTLGTVNAGTTTVSRLISTSAIDAPSINLTSPSAGIELGSPSTAGTPFIDFKTKGTNADYDIRLIANQTSFSITTPGVTLTDFNLKYIQNIRLHTTAASGIYMSRDALILRDHYNGNVSLSASKKSDSDTVGGDLYLGFTNTSMNAITNTVRLESAMTWKGSNQLVNTSGKLVGASLDTEYLKLTGGSLSNNFGINKNGSPGFDLVNNSVDTSVALPTTTQYSGLITFYENRAGSNMIRSRLESQILTNGHTYTSLYVRDSANATKSNIRLESETGLVNITTGGFRVSGSTTLVGDVTLSNNLDVGKTITATTSMYIKGAGNKHLWFGTGSGTDDKGLLYASDVGDIHLRSGNGGLDGIARVISRAMIIDGNIWANKYSHGYGQQYQTVAPLQVDFGQVPGNSDYYPIVRGTSIAAGAGYTTRVELGMLRSAPNGAGWGQANLIVGSAEAGDLMAIYSFDINGTMRVANQLISPSIALNGVGNSLGNGSIALGDNDTGLKWHSDGVFSLQSNGVQVAVLDTSGFRTEGGRNLVTHGDLNQASDSYSTYVRDIYVRSDIRVKTDLLKFKNASETLSKVNGYLYKQKKGEDSEGNINWVQSAGLIAQEVETVLPELISVDKDNPEGLLRLNYNGIIALNTAAINEHTKEINELKKQINELKSLVEILTK